MPAELTFGLTVCFILFRKLWVGQILAVNLAVFNYYVSVAKDEPFRSRFLEMVGLSLGVATLFFIIGYFIRQWLGIGI